MVQCVCVLGILESWQGHFLEADRYFNSVVDELQAMPLAIRFLPDAIESLIRLARLREAELLLDHFASTGKESKSWWALLATARCGALMRAASHDPVGAESLLRDSLHPLPSEAATIFPLEYARTLFVLGSVQRANRRYEPARTSLDQAHSIFENLGAVDWARKTGAELDRNAGRQAMPRKLTTTEERVAELTASGLTNQEIADVLFISVKTVEAHLTSIYRKVGVRSRVALAIWRGRRGATTSQAKD